MCSRICFFYTLLSVLPQTWNNQRHIFPCSNMETCKHNVSWWPCTLTLKTIETAWKPVTFDRASAKFKALCGSLSSLMQEKWCWGAGMKKTNTSSLPAVGSLMTPKRNGTNTQWVDFPLTTLNWRSWHWNGKVWVKVCKISCSHKRSSVILTYMVLTKTKN